MMTAIGIVLLFVISVCRQSHNDYCLICPVFVISVLYTQSHEDGCQLHSCVCDFSVMQTEPVLYTHSQEDCCQLHPCVCDFSVVHTEPWGRLSASSLSAFCFNSVCTLSLAKFTQVTSVFPIANINNKTSQYPPLLFRKRGRGNKTAIHNL